MIQTLIFDLGNVIVPFDFHRAYRKMEPLCGFGPEEIRSRIGARQLAPKLERGEMTPVEFVDAMNEVLGTRLGFEEFRDIWVSIFFPETLIPEPMVASLKQRYRLVLLSNTNALHFDWVDENYPILRHFEHRVLSHVVGATKPDPKIYSEAVRCAGCGPAECFFTDDIPDYVEGARKAGIDAEQFLGHAKLVADLRSRGIEV